MEAVQSNYRLMKEAWDHTKDSIAENPAAYKPHIGGASLEQLDEAVGIIGHWVDRARAPSGFAPTYRLSRALAATSMSAARTAAEALSRGELGHFPSFITAITQTISALHTVLVFSEPGVARSATGELAAKLAEALALLDTAQTELSRKMRDLQNATSSVAESHRVSTEISSWAETAEQATISINEHKESADAALEEISEVAEDLETLKKDGAELVRKAQELDERLTGKATQLDELIQKVKEQDELITALLPKGASAGLAHAFAGRVHQLERVKWIWMGAFALSMALLLYLAFRIVDVEGVTTAAALWERILQRLPLAAPMIWLGWFSAIQYGNTLRVQEDYAFKEATSKAFAGYRNHMEYLANVNLQEGNTAMTMMAARTINILAQEPLRIFKGIDTDASPGQGLLGRFRSGISAEDKQV